MHTINKLVVDLFLPNRIRENNGIDEANKLYADYIKETLDRVLSSYHENVDLIFTKLTIDLGTISYYEIPYELEKKLREIIDEQIIYSQYFSSNHFSSVVDKAPTSSIVDTMSNKSNVANTNCLQHLKPKSAESELVMDKKEYALEVLIEYMIYGYVELCG
ncbi:MAG: contractile injection system tape measure protein, partial [Paraprevotella sp.]|nr:contractile injection system tape measure protein [Paraprevotella sp.]